ncbi:MAG: ion transporter [Acidobacteria bacterium]|uniref:Ion transporter n=1 Tax=Candidatus Polarisedimenticola svalbardensis TaxID=2886004 RepID=A0A8J6Y9S4_9BACT|nr:ion transporter [Candidatus Polarisedimenticola svalbardensis]
MSRREQIDRYLSEPDSVPGRVVELVVGFLILGICGLFVWQSFPVSPKTERILSAVEWWVTLVFLLEYLLRLWAKGFSVQYILSPMAIIDLLACVPLLWPGSHMQFLRILRVFRILRLFRLVQSRNFFFGQITADHLMVLRILFTVFCLVFITGGLVFEAEHPENPGFQTLFDGLYFAIVSLTTVGFGDLIPVSWEGRFLTMGMILAGVLIIPWQLTTLARQIVRHETKRDIICARCGLQGHDPDASHCKACGVVIYQEYDGG